MGKQRVNVIGLGYIGLPTALMLAAHGAEVVGTDCNQEVVSKLQGASLTFAEDGMADLFQTAWKNGIRFTTSYVKSDFYIIAVATPFDKTTRKVDAQYVVSAVEQVLSVCALTSTVDCLLSEGEIGPVIIIESTVSPGTIDRYVRPLLEKYGFQDGVNIHLAHAPERIIPGSMLRELTDNPRTIGADSQEVGECVRQLYASFCRGDITLTSIRLAEMSKVVENAYRDLNIAFANELARICYAAKLDVRELIQVANQHPRVNILSPGPGVGGHCISVDPWFLVGDFPEETRLIRTVRETNDAMPRYVLSRVREIMEETGLRDTSRIGFYGLTYKEDVDDVRESPTLQLIEQMKSHLAVTPKSYDPLCEKTIVDNQCHDFAVFLRNIDLLVIMVNHRHLRENWNMVEGKIIFDTRACGLNPSGQKLYVML